jgi:hypothetical protein
MKPRVAAGLAASLALTTGGCRLLEMLKSDVVVSGIVFATPGLDHPGWISIEEEIVATAWVGRRISLTSTAAPSAVQGARVHVRFGERMVALAPDADQPGLYVARSSETPELELVDGAAYRFDVELGEVYGGEVIAPRRLSVEQLSFEPALGKHPLVPELQTHPRGEPLRIGWTAAEGRYAYVSVLRADPEHPDRPELVFDTRPQDAADALAALSDDARALDIPGEVFEPDGIYGLVVMLANNGAPDADTFLGSPLLVGSGVALLLVVGSPAL